METDIKSKAVGSFKIKEGICVDGLALISTDYRNLKILQTH